MGKLPSPVPLLKKDVKRVRYIVTLLMYRNYSFLPEVCKFPSEGQGRPL